MLVRTLQFLVNPGCILAAALCDSYTACATLLSIFLFFFLPLSSKRAQNVIDRS